MQPHNHAVSDLQKIASGSPMAFGNATPSNACYHANQELNVPYQAIAT